MKKQNPVKKKKIIHSPEEVKYTKQHKGCLVGLEHKASSIRLVYGLFGLKILTANRFRVKQLETVRKQISGQLKKNQFLWIRITPDIPVTRKPKEIRMGKGKGLVSEWIVKLKPGHILLELSSMTYRKAFMILNQVAKKLAVPTAIVFQKEKLLF
jgi:large subunit ribosomal protein L16